MLECEGSVAKVQESRAVKRKGWVGVERRMGWGKGSIRILRLLTRVVLGVITDVGE